jgi:hypothetical protein
MAIVPIEALTDPPANIGAISSPEVAITPQVLFDLPQDMSMIDAIEEEDSFFEPEPGGLSFDLEEDVTLLADMSVNEVSLLMAESHFPPVEPRTPNSTDQPISKTSKTKAPINLRDNAKQAAFSSV